MKKDAPNGLTISTTNDRWTAILGAYGYKASIPPFALKQVIAALQEADAEVNPERAEFGRSLRFLLTRGGAGLLQLGDPTYGAEEELVITTEAAEQFFTDALRVIAAHKERAKTEELD